MIGKYILFLLLAAVMLYVPLLSAAEEDLSPENAGKAALAEAVLFQKGGEYQKAALRASEAAFLVEKPGSAEWNEALELALKAYGQYKSSQAGKAVRKQIRRLRIYRAEGILLLFENGMIAGNYPVACGPEETAPAGRFTIGNILGYPVWKEGDTVHPAGSPGNILGSRWVEFQDAEGKTVSGLHGRRNGKQGPGGTAFFSLNDPEVRQLAELLRKGDVVEVE